MLIGIIYLSNDYCLVNAVLAIDNETCPHFLMKMLHCRSDWSLEEVIQFSINENFLKKEEWIINFHIQAYHTFSTFTMKCSNWILCLQTIKIMRHKNQFALLQYSYWSGMQPNKSSDPWKRFKYVLVNIEMCILLVNCKSYTSYF